MNVDIFFRNLLMGLIVFYFAQGSLYTTGTILSQIALFVILSISLVYFFKIMLLKQKDLFVIIWSALLLVNMFGFLFTGDLANYYHFSTLTRISITLLPFYAFYYFARKDILRAKHLIFFFLIMLPVSILMYYFNQTQVLSTQLSNNVVNSNKVVNNVTFTFVGLIPFVFLFKNNKIYAISFLMVLMYFIIMGSKRGALLSGAVGLLLFIYFQMNDIEKRKRFKGYVFVFIGILVLGYFVYDLLLSNQYLMNRLLLMQKGDSSQRNIIFPNIFNAWYTSDSYVHLLFGFGFDASLKLSGTGNFAHNDWLELLSNFGLFGLSIYLLLFYAAFKSIRNCHWQKEKKILMFTVLILWFSNSLTTPGYNSTDNYSLSIMFAYLIGNKSKELK
jgi:O-antigen ligase